MQNALRSVLGEKTVLMAAGRTDTGVHAKQMFAHFDTNTVIDSTDLSYRMNAMLPKTIVVKRFFKVIATAHARFDAKYRSYEYHIHLEQNPFLLTTTWQIYNRNINVKLMNEAAAILIKHTDFKAFSKQNTSVKTHDCTVTRAEWIQKENQLIFYITANRFLRNMVRAIVGTLLEVGEEKISIASFENIIISQNRSNAGLSVPASGLFLTEVGY